LVAFGFKGTGTTALVLMDNRQTPLAAVITSANEHESQHIERLLDAAVVPLPKKTHLVYDKAADSDPLRWRLLGRGITLIAPYRENRTDGRRLHYRHKRRLRQRWKIERTNAWLHRYGRLAIRKDRRADMFLGWTQLACLVTILQRF
jgi:transposase